MNWRHLNNTKLVEYRTECRYSREQAYSLASLVVIVRLKVASIQLPLPPSSSIHSHKAKECADLCWRKWDEEQDGVRASERNREKVRNKQLAVVSNRYTECLAGRLTWADKGRRWTDNLYNPAGYINNDMKVTFTTNLIGNGTIK